MDRITLRDGNEVPRIGLGTWQLTGARCTESVTEAISMGYRHIDTAFAYGNHAEVAAGIEQSGVRRDELFVTTKIPLGKQSRSQVIQQGDKLTEQLRTDYVDLLLIHWPDRDVPFEETLGAMKELVDRGTVRSVGISNFNPDLVQQADSVSPVPIVTNQVEFHPLLYQKKLLDTCRSLDVTVTAYSPLARGEAAADDRLAEIGRAHDASAAQVAIAWLLAHGIIAIPKASSAEHLRSNLEATDMELSDDEVARIDGFGDHRRLLDGPWKHFPLE